MQVKILAQPDVSYAKTLTDLGSRLFAETFADHNPPDDMQAYLDSAYLPEIQTKELSDPSIHTFMAFNEANVAVGFAQLRQNKYVYEFVDDPQAIELQRIYVDTSCKGQGVAHKLMEACITKAAELGKKTIWLGVWEHNPRALKFYSKYGFRTAGSHVFKVGSKIDTDLVMIKTLP